MSRRFAGGRLLLATHNRGKLEELRTLFQPRGVALVSSAELGLVEPEETGTTFAANARLKAAAAVAASGLPALADDSGLALSGLDGAPGVHSARWAGPERDFAAAMARVRAALIERYGSFATAERAAAFVAVLCLMWPDGHTEEAEGRVDGAVVDPPRGTGGFGYDPMFQPAGCTSTFGEMPPADKHRLSHRGRALQQLLERCF